MKDTNRYRLLFPKGNTMSLSLKYPEDFEAYAIGKILRQKAAYNAYERHGYVWYKPLTGLELVTELCLKSKEESAEVSTAHTEWQFQPEESELRQDLIGELGDLADATDKLQQALGVLFTGKPMAGNMNMVQARWAGFANTLQPNFDEVAEAINYTQNSISRYLKQWSITREELDAARLMKDQTKGPMLPGRVDFLALPKDDDWVPHMRSKFKQVALENLESCPAAHPDLLPVTSG